MPPTITAFQRSPDRGKGLAGRRRPCCRHGALLTSAMTLHPSDDIDPLRRQFLAGAVATGLLAAAPASSARAQAADETITESPKLAPLFESAAVSGTFVLYEEASARLTAFARDRAVRRYVPASSFKIANSLIALETGVVSDENEVIPYGGRPQPFDAWEKDMSMREAVPASNVPVFQELARRIGLEAYRRWLAELDYGNRQIGTALETFWLDGPLKISAVEQAKFSARLARGRLPLSQRTQGIVRDILLLEQGTGWKLYGKTGWRFSSTPPLGWWTGWVERSGKVSAFALNIDMPTSEDAKKRVDLGKRALQALAVLP
jgi:beta-lactamase class D